MIWESQPWKEELLRTAGKLRKRTQQKRWTARSDANFEKEVFFAFYAIRKLVEAHKLSDSTVAMTISARTCPLRPNKRVTFRNWHRLEELFDLDDETHARLDLRFLCNQIIHSYIFFPMFDDEGQVERIAVCSDRKRHECVYVIEIADVIDVLEQVGSDYPDTGHFEWDESIQDYRVTSEMREACSDPRPGKEG